MTWSVRDRWETANPFLSTGDPRVANIALNATGTNYWNTAAFDYFSDAAVVGDYLYFAATRQYWGIKLEVGTAFAASSVTFTWEYKTGSSTWATLPVSNPNALTATGTQIVLFTPPDEDWYADMDKGMAIRCRISALTGLTEGGANATNKVGWLFKALQVTGTVTDLDSAVTADLAGSYTLLAAATPAASMTPLRMPVRSLRAMSKVDVTLAGGTSGAGDTVTLTGLDYGGAAFTETLDVSAGNGTYSSTRYFSDLTDVACAGWSDGTVEVTQRRWGLIAAAYPGNYTFGACLIVGDESTTTAVTLKDLALTFVHGAFWYVTGGATLTLGEIWNSGDAAEMGTRGCTIKEQNPQLGIAYIWNRFGGAGSGGYTPSSAAAINLYGTHWYIDNYGYNSPRAAFRGSSCTLMAKDCLFVTNSASDANPVFLFFDELTLSLVRTNIAAETRFLYISTAPTFDRLRLGTTARFASVYPLTLTRVDATSFLNWHFLNNGRLYFVDGTLDEADFAIGWSGIMTGECVYLQYSFDLTVIDAAGSAISGATVTIEDADGATVYSGTTDASGQIPTQTLNRKIGSHAASASVYTWDSKTPHKLTVSKTGLSDYVMLMTMDQARDELLVMTAGGVIVIED